MLGSLLKAKSHVCPFCFDELDLGMVPFRCASPMSICTPEHDPVLAEKWGVAVPVQRVVTDKPSGGKARCGNCNQWSTKRLCPHCHQDLPRTFGDYDNYVFAMIGAKAAGKSNYLATLVQQIQHHVGPALDMLLEPANDATIQRYKTEFHEPVYKKRRPVAATTNALTKGAGRLQLPLVYCLVFSEKNVFGQRKIRKVVTLTFFDTAGEDLNSLDLMSIVARYIYRSHGIVLLLDPLQLDTVRDQLTGSGVALPDQNTETSEILTRVAALIRTGRSLGADHPIGTPIAITFSKFDAVASLLSPQMQVLATSSHVGGFDKRDFLAVNQEMQSLLDAWQGQFLTHQVKTHFKYYAYFGLTALGCSPDASGTLPNVLPRRVEDPLLWLLHHHGVIKPATVR